MKRPAILRSVWAWLGASVFLAIVAYLMFNLNLRENAHVKSTLAAMPTTEYAVTMRGIIDVEGGLIRLSAAATGLINDVLVAEGDSVAAGQLLAIQDDRDAAVSLKHAKIALENAKIRLEGHQLDLAIARRTADRGKQQRAEDAITAEQYQDQLDAVRRRELAVSSQASTVASNELAVETAELELGRRKLTSPVDGQVIKVNIAPGSGVSLQNVSTAILIKPHRDKIIRVGVGETDVDDISVGQRVDVSRIGRDDEQFEGAVVSISQVYQSILTPASSAARNQAQTIEVVVNVGDIPLRLGQPVLVKFVDGDSPVATE